ncbi:MAG: hypothetical protein NZV14_04830 [Bryobacteraceae bacterium]|nr:hypothetical protein [Bryobacteraceae bacterium]MDW8377459.1 hypothetical protein [Bryobacterales bacterium]
MRRDLEAGVWLPQDLRRGEFTYFPVVPGRLEFAVALRRKILKMRPRVVAVELPGCFAGWLLEGVQRLPQMSVILCTSAGEEEEENAVYYPIEPGDPFVEAVRSGLEVGAELLFLEPDTGQRPHLPSVYPDTAAVGFLGLERYVELYRLFPPPRTAGIESHASALAWKLQGADSGAPTLIVLSLNLLEAVLEAMEQPQPEPRPAKSRLEVSLLNPHPDCLAEITVEIPWVQEKYLAWRETLEGNFPDRARLQYELLKEAGENYEAITGDRISPWQRRALAVYTRNLARTDGDLVASLYDLTLAARAVVDDNYAWEVWQTANRYFPQQDTSDLQTVRLTAEEVFLNTRKIKIRRRLPRPKQLTRPTNLKPRKKEGRPGEWAEQLGGNAICSYPPEDLVIEDYGRYLKQKARSMISEERSRVEPFTTTLADGIDIRETIRNWHQGKIYVRHAQRAAGEAGAVVLIFDEDREGRYRYLTTWLGEHQNESDMAFYSTPPFDHLVGPGIGRAEYGGLLMTLPPRRMFDVWTDPDYDFAETKAERLLMAGLDYSLDRYVVYVAARPPRSIFRSIASHLGKQIVYIPLGQLSPSKLKKIRIVHVLDGYHRREIAKDYIW